MIYKLQRIVTLSAFFYSCAFVIAILLCNVRDVALLRMYVFFVNMDFFIVILDIFRVMHET